MSPLFFILVMETPTKLANKALEEGFIDGVHIGRSF